MATKEITGLHRVIMRAYKNGAWTPELVFEPDDLGQDAVLTFNIAPRKRERASSTGTTSTPVKGTFDSLTASITFLNDTWAKLGKAMRGWTAATFAGATAENGQMVIGDGSDFCNEDEYIDIVVQNVCDDGSASDVEFTRCMPSIDDDIEVGSTETGTVTLNLNPIIYNATRHSGDGYPAYTARLGDNSLVENQRLNATTGEYEAVSES